MTTTSPRGAHVSADGAQLSFDELGTPLHTTTFVVFDLETTGTSPENDAVTEIGAVKVRGGQVLGEFATLVDPQRPIESHIVTLTGITTEMVTGAPPLATILPAFLEFASGAVLVAHNAPFDVGFLRAACERHGYSWGRPPVLCTVRLARRVLSRDEAPSCRLSALAALFRASTEPNHRALADARATMDVLHGLLERVGPLGVRSLEELLGFLPEVTPAQRRKRHLAAHLPRAPGVYLFRGPSDEVLYVGTAGDLRRRVRQYFTASEGRGRLREMVALASRVDAVVCAHALEAEVRELRLLGAHRPPYNRRSKNAYAAWWVVLTDEPFPRLSVVRQPRDGALGPFGSHTAALAAVDALHHAVPIRPCTQRIPARDPRGQPCVLAELGRCAAPCAGRQTAADYAPAVRAIRALIDGRTTAPLHVLAGSLAEVSTARRYEAAAGQRDRMVTLIRALERGQRLTALASVGELVAARPDDHGGWDVAVIRYGRLASAGVAAKGVPPMPVIEALIASAETVVPGPGPLCGAPVDEAKVLSRWLRKPGSRLVRTTSPWSEPARSAATWREWVRQAVQGRATALPD